jgi:hypothetical protein
MGWGTWGSETGRQFGGRSAGAGEQCELGLQFELPKRAQLYLGVEKRRSHRYKREGSAEMSDGTGEFTPGRRSLTSACMAATSKPKPPIP